MTGASTTSSRPTGLTASISGTWRFELARENSVYVHETDGYAIDRVVARYNDLYGILTFTSDHGLIKDCETHHNGDSGVYPGSAADVNAANASPPPLERWSVEVVGCNTHHNALGFSGTAGNSVWFHDNQVHHNGAGYVTDSFVGGHPGMPQDHAWVERNRIYANNVNYYVNVQGDDPPCKKRPTDVGYQNGVVCPAFPVPVGTGVLIAGGNLNLVSENQIYDNWRNGAMLFWVPGAIRGDMGVEQQLDTSNGNRYVGNSSASIPPASCSRTASTSGGTTRASATAGRTTRRPQVPSRRTRRSRCCRRATSARCCRSATR